jgi:hypothetical protein
LPAIEHETLVSTGERSVVQADVARAELCGGAALSRSEKARANSALLHRLLATRVRVLRSIARSARGKGRDPLIRLSSRVKNPERSGGIGLAYAITSRVIPIETALQRGGAVGVPAHPIDGTGTNNRN